MALPGLSGAPVLHHEDEHLLVVEKPAGMLTHPVRAGQRETLADWVRERCAGEAHLVGRLDRDTSGLVLAARDRRARARLDRMLSRRAVRRGYRAVVSGCPDSASGTIDAPIGRDPADPPLRAVIAGGAPAVTHYRLIRPLMGAALLELELETGRTHQIRVHLAHLGHPVLGDRWYGRAGLEMIARQALHAWRLRLTHPFTGAGIDVQADLPADIESLLRGLALPSPRLMRLPIDEHA